MLKRLLPILAFALLAGAVVSPGLPSQDESPVLWPDRQREFLQDGPAWLLDEETLAYFLTLELDEREAFILDFLGAADLAEGDAAVLEEAVRRRRLLVQQ